MIVKEVLVGVISEQRSEEDQGANCRYWEGVIQVEVLASASAKVRGVCPAYTSLYVGG